MTSYIKKCFLGSLLLMASAVATAEDKLKILFIGQPQAGPPIILLNAYAQELNVPYEFVSMKDCSSAKKIIDSNPNVMYFMADLVTMHGKRLNDPNCTPESFKADQIIGTTASAWHLCKKAGSQKKFGEGRFTVGIASVLPVTGISKDFNEQNGKNMIPVGLKSSSQVAAALINRDIDFGMVNPGVAEPLMDEGKLDCSMTFIPEGTAKVGADMFIGNHYKMKMPDLACHYFLVAKTENADLRKTLLDTANSEGFKSFLEKAKYSETRLDGKFTDKDIENYNSYINKMLTELYGIKLQ